MFMVWSSQSADDDMTQLRGCGLLLMKRRGVAGAVEEDDCGEQHGDERGGEADVEVGVVADDSDEGRGDGVAEGVDDEELAGERGGADLGTNGVDGGGVDGASSEEDQEDGGGEAIQGEG